MALQKAFERKANEMCKYCDGIAPVGCYSDELEVEHYIRVGCEYFVDKNMNYCPMCGKKLNTVSTKDNGNTLYALSFCDELEDGDNEGVFGDLEDAKDKTSNMSVNLDECIYVHEVKTTGRKLRTEPVLTYEFIETI